jgi:hypothetical protein
VQLRFDDDADVPLQRAGAGIQSGPIVWTKADGSQVVGDWDGEELYRFVADDPRAARSWEAVRLAAMARAIDTAMHSDSPAARFVLGRFIESVRLADRHTRKRIVDQMLYPNRAKGARNATAVRKRDADERAALLIQEYKCRRKDGEKSGDIINAMSTRPGGLSTKRLRAIIKPRSRDLKAN